MKKILTTMAIVLAAVALIIVLKNEYGAVFAGHTYGIPAAVEQEEIDHLFIGSSMFRQGMDIDVLEEHLEGKIYILSYNGNQPVFMAKELEYMLENGVKVNKLYVDFYTYSMTAVPWIFDTKLFLDTDLGFKIDAWKTMNKHSDMDFNDFYEMFVTDNNEQILMYPINNLLVSSQFRNGGSLLMPDGQDAEYLDTLDLGVRDGLNEAQIAAYDRIVEIAKEHEIEVVFIETPKYEKLLTDTRKGSYSDLLAEMVAWAEESGVEYLLAEDVEFDHADGANFQDLIHLSGQGRKTYSEELIKYISK